MYIYIYMHRYHIIFLPAPGEVALAARRPGIITHDISIYLYLAIHMYIYIYIYIHTSRRPGILRRGPAPAGLPGHLRYT